MIALFDLPLILSLSPGGWRVEKVLERRVGGGGGAGGEDHRRAHARFRHPRRGAVCQAGAEDGGRQLPGGFTHPENSSRLKEKYMRGKFLLGHHDGGQGFRTQRCMLFHQGLSKKGEWRKSKQELPTDLQNAFQP